MSCRWIAALTLAVSAACSTAAPEPATLSAAADQGTSPALSDTTPSPSSVDDTSATSEAFLCGPFGDERLPVVIALDRDDGSMVWRTCAGDAASHQVLVSDAAVVRFGAVGVGMVESVNPQTGVQHWSHPAEDSRPIALVRDVLVEASGIGYTEAPPGTHPADAGRVTLRAINATTMLELWSYEVQAAPVLNPGEATITVSSDRVAVAASQETVFLDLFNGNELRREDGQWRIDGDLQITNRYGADGVLYDVRSSNGFTRSFGLDTSTVSYGTSSTDLYVSRVGEPAEPSEGPAIVDRASGTSRWSVGSDWFVDGGDGVAVLTDGTVVRLVDGGDGHVLWTFDLAQFRAGFAGAQIGDGLVYIIPS